ncbi:hypothetical protein OS493_017160 [Desmophyllum pertusum]|uniref:Uncharacterized protein n=1 Tax=Desmophyllum pertusum TaxID=174260 RepID=A0A9W9YE09_9CNID|nr:hypothetical protein OS493_017160 [Desmophyllum pertusum]
MKATIILIFILLATATPTGQWVTKSRHSLDSNSWHLTHLTMRNDFLLPSIFTICGSLLALSLIAAGTRSSLWPKIKTVKKTGARTEPSLSYAIPLYVHRITQTRDQLAAQRHFRQINVNTGLPQNNDTDYDTNDDCELWKKRREKIREKKKGRLAKGPRINPEELRRINQEWHLYYGFENSDLFHIENELDNTVAKVPSVHSKKAKTIKFDDSVDIVLIEKHNTGRRVNRKVPRHAVKCAPSEVTRDQQIIV